MGNAIITRRSLQRSRPTSDAATASTAADGQLDGLLDKLIKLVPSEVISLYAALSAFVTKDSLRKASFFVCLVLTAVVVARPAKAADGQRVKAPWQQYLLSAVAFVLWATLINHPLDSWIAIDREYVGFAAFVFTAVAPFLIRE
jgi:hypothetical protein